MKSVAAQQIRLQLAPAKLYRGASLLVTLTIVMNINETFFGVYEAARQLGCTSQWIRVLLAEQRLTGAQKIDGQWRIPASALDEMKQHRVTVTA